uniref:Uncharacterized protein n=1 Tax=Arundo donax TaxID=35708 RepID=A0A0A8Z384_ARUDO
MRTRRRGIQTTHPEATEEAYVPLHWRNWTSRMFASFFLSFLPPNAWSLFFLTFFSILELQALLQLLVLSGDLACRATNDRCAAEDC